MTAITAATSRFFSWWFGELSALMPGALKARLHPSPAVTIRLQNQQAIISSTRNDLVTELGRIDLSTKKDQRNAVAVALRRLDVRDVEIIYQLASEAVLRREIDLPVAAAENLREVLSFEMDRHTPFRAEDVAFAHRIIRADPNTRRLLVELVVVPRQLLEQVNSTAESLGLAPDRIGVAEGHPDLDFLAHDSSSEAHGGRRMTMVLGALVLALAAAAVYVPLYLQHAELRALEARLESSRAAAMEVEALRKTVDAGLDQARFLLDQRNARPSFVELLREITARLPDDTWLTRLRWQKGVLTLAGFSPSAAGLIGELEASPLLSEVRFAAPVTMDARVERERFNLSAAVAAETGG